MPGPRRRALAREKGTTLVEAAVGLGVIAVALAGLAPLLVRTTIILRDSAAESRALAAAVSRMEELHALTYEESFDTLAPVTDSTTDLSTSPAGSTGNGMVVGVASTAWHDAPGYVDALRLDGEAAADDEAAVRRRWAMSRAPSGGPGDPVIVQVLAVPVPHDLDGAPRASAARRPGDVWLFGWRARILR